MTETQAPYETEEPGDGTYNSADRRQVRKAAQDQERREKQLEDITRQLLSVPDGRTWLAWVLFEVCGLRADAGPLPSEVVQYRKGAADVGVTLQNRAMAASKANFIKLLEEHL